MDIHKPKAAHSWREFLIEIGTIICGILIALGLEQAVEAVRTHDTVEALRKVLNRELATDRARVELTHRDDACNRRLIARLMDDVEKGSPELRRLEFSIQRPALQTSAWELARSNPAFSHMPLQEQTAYATLYDILINQQHFLFEEQSIWRGIKGGLVYSSNPDVRRQLAPQLTAVLGYQSARERNYPYLVGRFDDARIRADHSIDPLVDLDSCAVTVLGSDADRPS